jgi:MoaA/NifB/PqqE/SkfB family radical SAM enzyme
MNVLGDGGPISIPPDNNITIAPDGTVSACRLFGTPNNSNVVGRIKLVNPPEKDLARGRRAVPPEEWPTGRCRRQRQAGAAPWKAATSIALTPWSA